MKMTTSTSDSDFVVLKVPKPWRTFLRQGTMRYDWRRTCLVRLFNEERGARIAQFFVGTKIRTCIFFGPVCIGIILMWVLGLFQIVPVEVFIIGASLGIIWLMIYAAIVVDTGILCRVVLRSTIFWVNFVLSSIVGVMFCTILDYDIRGILFIPIAICTSLIVLFGEAMPLKFRGVLVPGLFGIAAITWILLYIAVWLGAFPGQLDPPLNIWEVSGIGRYTLSTSAYSLFSSSIIGQIALYLNELRHRWPERRVGTLRLATIGIVCRDVKDMDEKYLSFSLLDRFL